MASQLTPALVRALEAARRGLQTHALEGIIASTNPVRFNHGVEALVEVVRYEVDRRSRPVTDWLRPGVPLDWTKAQWADHHARIARLNRIEPGTHLVLADFIQSGQLTYGHIRGYMHTGQFLDQPQQDSSFQPAMTATAPPAV